MSNLAIMSFPSIPPNAVNANSVRVARPIFAERSARPRYCIIVSFYFSYAEQSPFHMQHALFIEDTSHVLYLFSIGSWTHARQHLALYLQW